MSRTLSAVLIAAAVLGCADIAGKERSRGPGDFTLEELVGIRSWVDGAADWSPDASTLTFVGRDSLWTVPAAGGTPQALPVHQPSTPAYSPDGRWIGYVSGTGNDQELWLWAVADRRATRLTRLGARINSWSWAPDSRRLALSSLHRGNYDVYVVQVPDGQVQRLTTDARYDVHPTWTPDGRTVVYVRMDEAWVNHEVIAIDAATGTGERALVSDTDFFDYRIGAEFGPAQVSAKGDLVLFRSHRSNWLNWWLVPLAGGRPRPLAPEAADQNAQKPFRGYARWSPDGSRVAYTSNLNGTMVLRVATVADGAVRTLVAPELGVVANHTWSPDGRRLVYTYDTPRQPMDLFVVDLESGTTRRLTQSLRDTTLSQALFLPEKVQYPSTAGLTINAYLYRPATPPPAGGHPAIVWIHGGPTSQFDDGWGRHWEAQHYIKHGYAVLLPNIRGSSGYGRDFEKLSERCWGRCDMEDVVAGVKYLGTLPDLNADRVAATGTSYGGFMSIAAGTFAPGVFRAALPTGSGYSDWLAAWHDFFPLAEIKLLDYELGDPVRNRDVYLRTSPFYHARQLDTPMLLVGSDAADAPMRTFADEAARYYKPVRYLGLAQSGSPARRLEWMPQALEFLDRHVKGPVQLTPGPPAAIAGASPGAPRSASR